MRRAAIILGLVVAAAGCGNDKPGINPNDPRCQLHQDSELFPGYPYSLDIFKTQVLPAIKSCGMGANCHASPTGVGNFTVWLDAAPGNCSYAQTFNSLKDNLNTSDPPNSAAYTAITGADPNHPVILPATDATAQAILMYVQNAQQTLIANGMGPGMPPPTSANPFDYNVYQQQIQPILDLATCSNTSSCHGTAAGQNGLRITPNPAPGSPEMEANFNSVVAKCDINNPMLSTFYINSTTVHDGGLSRTVDGAGAGVILSWIQQAKVNQGTGGVGGGGNGCADPSNFSVGVFASDIEPILKGLIDLNNPGSTQTATGCTRQTCHGQDRSGGALVLKDTNTSAQNLANFVCFVNLTNPTQSDVLLCPLNQPGCRHYPHPGMMIFQDGNDLNYQRFLSYLLAAKTVTNPMDFAFYVRQIDPIFNDLNSVQGGAQGRTCADTTSCHGVTVNGQPAPNGSNFPILANAGDKDRWAVNFGTALNFVNFLDARGSALFLYPTDQISNLANPFATGLHHPGGADFDPDNSVQAAAILKWAGGLEPDANGFNANWLVAGDYNATRVQDQPLPGELTITPAIFDPDGASTFNNGQWDGFFPNVNTIDFAAEFPRASNSGRIAYAVAYILNVTPTDIQAQIVLNSPNAAQVYFGAAQGQSAGGQLSVGSTLPDRTQRKTTRVLIKLFQAQADAQFEFTAQFTDQFGTPLTNVANKQLVFKLSPDGGI